MRKIACVFSFQESSWVSCQKIVFNLHQAYERVPGLDLKNFHYGSDFHSFDVQDLADQLIAWEPDSIVFLDHKPHPLFVLKHMIQHYENTKRPKPRIIFHVFGDFTLWYRDWSPLGFLLKGYHVEFIVASERQKILIDKFLAPHMESVVVPFPVRKEDFYYDPKEREAQRKAWGVSDDDIVFTFTGRISRQKRTHKLLEYFHEATEKETKVAHLFIYGLPDNIGDNFLNVWDNENEYFRKVHRIYRALPESTRSRIHFMGSVPNKELRAVYAGADYLINLSVHNDEDFGMSVAEAQMSGLPSILTDWGGLAGFYHPELPEATKYVPVWIGNTSKVLSKKETLRHMRDVINSTERIDRKKLTALAYEKLSVNSAGDLLINIIESTSKKFIGFSEFHEIISNRLKLGKIVYLTKDYKIHPLFRKLYSSYVRNP